MNAQMQQTQGNFTINYFNAEHLNSVQRIAKMFCASDLVPKIYRIDEVGENKAIANTIIALDMASRLNANPLMIMQNLNIIQGRPSWSSKFLIAMVNTCGKYEQLEYKFENRGKIKNIPYIEYVWENGRAVSKNRIFSEEIDNIVCYAYTKKHGKDEVLQSTEISMEMAIKEGWYTKAGSKWPIMPKQMLIYRASSFWCSIYAPDLSMGIKTIEENEDIEDVQAEVIPNKQVKDLNDSLSDLKPNTKPKADENKPVQQMSLNEFVAAV